MGGDTACADTCQSCNSAVNNGRADSFDRDAMVTEFDVLKDLEDLFHDKDQFAQYLVMLDMLKANQ